MKPRALCLFAILSCSLTGHLLATSLYWDNGAGTANWGDVANWSTAEAGGAGTDPTAVPGVNDVATFNVTGLTHASSDPKTINLGGDIELSGLKYTGQTNLLTLRGGTGNVTLKLGAAGIVASGTGSSSSTTVGTVTTLFPSKTFTLDNTISVSLMADQKWESNIVEAPPTTPPTTSVVNTDGIFVSGPVSLGIAGNHTLTLGGTSGTTPANTISGVISDGGTDRSLAITLNGTTSNRWTLSGINTYTGATTITSGALTIGHINALGATSAGTTVASGAGLFFRNTVGTMAAEALTISGTGPDNKGVLRNVGGNNNWTGAISLGSATVAIGADGGTFTLNSSAAVGLASGVSASTLQFVTTSATATSSVVVNGDITGAISINKGAVTNSNASPNASVTFGTTAKTYTGSTTITSGIFVLNTGLTNTSSFTAAANSVVRGNGGSINNLSTTTINGTLAPGASAAAGMGTMAMGRLDLGATSTLSIDINSATGATDLITLAGTTGNLNIASGAKITLADMVSTTNTVNGALLFIKYSGVWNGTTFMSSGGTAITDGQIVSVGANQYQFDYDIVDGTGHAVGLILIPEPSGALLAALAGGACLARRRRKA